MTGSKGYLAIILHAHLPYVRHPEYEDALEESWLYEAITESYIPLLLVLESLVEDNIDFRITFSITPTLASMFMDPLLQSRYLSKLDGLIEFTQKEIRRTDGQPQFNVLARMYHQQFTGARAAFVRRYRRNLMAGFKRLQKLGKLEILASAATHGYLPLLSVNPSAIRAQIQIGIDNYRKVFNQKPRGFWLPECGYYPRVDEFLREGSIRHTILETHGITRAEPRPKYGVNAPIYCPSGVAAFGRDPESSKQVWSSVEGYPGDFDYREFYRDVAYDLDFDYIKPYIHKDGIRRDTGIKYYRITGKTDHKEVYIPEWAEKKAEMHAGNFIFNRGKQIDYLASVMDRKPIVVAPYDAELFGHWWFEGPQWLNYLIRKIALEQKTIRLITLSEYLEEYPLNQEATPCMSSWGFKGFSDVWLNGKNDWIYPHLHAAAEAMEDLATSQPGARGLKLRALNQASRELLLAQASDWAFMMAQGTTSEYATRRTKTHLARFQNLARQVKKNKVDKKWLAAVERQDNIFPSDIYGRFRRAASPSVSKARG
jgi:1,4-alpha-glucan branching enzyme